MVRDRQPSQFTDRESAGKQLGDALREEGVDADIVLAIPRGGLPLGRMVADALHAPLDIVATQKIGAPNNPEFAIGAVAADGSAWLNEEVIERRGIDREYIERVRSEEAENAREKAETYRDDGSLPDLSGKTVVVVDDGVATGATARACLSRVNAAAPERVIFAVPVGSPRAISDLEGLADEVVCLSAPSVFHAVGQFYERFGQVTDEEAMAYLAEE
ncbi:phosphoribosyltransferase [Halogeometricum borinquense]|uniref:Phosphoribosyltransferase n=1 Tax=Halogeometricum borinquense TaxID=60847 RepID=A0A482T8T3_9EURY|nr:phosphoribosyltransferase family protein [Halogeometricum borinquense]RYJ14274.1 phosphoribosyltransferase [Halogeometricum borinquense]